MQFSPVSSGGVALPRRRLTRRGTFLSAVALSALLVATIGIGGHLASQHDISSLTGVSYEVTGSIAPTQALEPALSPARRAMAATTDDYALMMQPTPTLPAGVMAFRQDAPLTPGFRIARAIPEAPAEPQTYLPQSDMQTARAEPVEVEPVEQAPQAMANLEPAALDPAPIPMPVPRPPELRFTEPRTEARNNRQTQRAQTTVVPATPQTADNRSFFEKLFNPQPAGAPGPALAYASPEADINLRSAPSINPAPNPAVTAGTAVYNISARAVTLPNGEVLEAHSGLGDKLDDPNYVHVRMQGATPPGTYNLVEREALFHGVRAIRMNPVGGSGAIHGRGGILAHTYMLGPRGDSNGCISFKDYNRFLQAYLRGEVRRIVVVTGRGDALPSFASRRNGRNVAANAGGV
ncbi:MULTISPECIES: tlde1 domain-containing protein [unclassified Beijerinckia]|uniref:tlde1 domain-containing protein n=1 Tax=unclassified Beijerinckia TaxID=2638183 RepID=UPI000894A554|nr:MULTISPECIES: tlde1 domain-containing protein [unclassified Beijerinckia]MDH7797608.1 hypothetical protein [Beijerinckia sp. GAS462]SEC92190.1 Protein of unknown function [Beijerinckia sp. 28-YEA-48]